MEKENKFLNVITFANLLLICVCIVGCLYCIATTNNAYYIIESLIEIITLVAAIAYATKGYKKDAAKFYKLFMLFMAGTYVVEYLLSTLIPSDGSVTGLYTAFSLILYGNTLLLAVAKDLGKKVSVSLASFNFAVYLGTFIGSFFRTYPSQHYKIVSIIMTLTWFALAGITLLITFAKYIDKAQRNTK